MTPRKCAIDGARLGQTRAYTPTAASASSAWHAAIHIDAVTGEACRYSRAATAATTAAPPGEYAAAARWYTAATTAASARSAGGRGTRGLGGAGHAAVVPVGAQPSAPPRAGAVRRIRCDRTAATNAVRSAWFCGPINWLASAGTGPATGMCAATAIAVRTPTPGSSAISALSIPLNQSMASSSVSRSSNRNTSSPYGRHHPSSLYMTTTPRRGPPPAGRRRRAMSRWPPLNPGCALTSRRMASATPSSITSSGLSSSWHTGHRCLAA